MGLKVVFQGPTGTGMLDNKGIPINCTIYMWRKKERKKLCIHLCYLTIIHFILVKKKKNYSFYFFLLFVLMLEIDVVLFMFRFLLVI
jgi:hypothetical protein